MAYKAKLGSGTRFQNLKGALAKKGASNPAGLAAYIGRKKYGTKKFASLSAKGRKRKGKRVGRKSSPIGSMSMGKKMGNRKTITRMDMGKSMQS